MPSFKMGRRLLFFTVLILLYRWAFGLPAWLSPKQAQTAFQSPLSPQSQILEQPWKKRIVAVGDLHGDLAHALKILRIAGIVDHRGYWSAKDTVLVQTGDIVDRGPDTIAIYRLFDTLRTQAADVGGEVVSLLGNHEMMNVMGDWRYVTKEDIATFHGEQSRRRAFSSGWIGQTFLANYSVATQVPYTPVFAGQLNETLARTSVVAVHGGIHPSWANIERINSVGHSFLQRLISAGIPKVMSLPRDTPEDERDLYSATGPLWYRGYALDSEDDGICEQAEHVLQTLNATRMIMGHTPQFKGIWSRCRGKVIVIDTGMSSAYGGPLSALEIVYSLSPVVDEEAEGEIRLAEKEIVTAIYEGSRQVLVRKERTIENK